MIDLLTREIWNILIVEPKNKTGNFQLSPKKLRDIIEKHLKDGNKTRTNFKENTTK